MRHAKGTRTSTLLVGLGLLGLPGCGSDDPAPAPPVQVHHGLTCDFLNHTLSLVDLDALRDGATRADALVAEIDLSAYPAGPLDAEIIPGTKIAMVSLSAGFFSLSVAGVLIGAEAIPADPGKLLFVDLEARQVVAELDTGQHPMGIAITHDAARAFVAHFATQEVAVIDVKARSVLERVPVGPFSEEIALDDSGQVGIFSYSALGNVRTFAPSDFAGTLSRDVELPGDAAGVAFFPGTKIAYVVQAPNPLTRALGGYTVVDASDPREPRVLADVHMDGAPIAYPAVSVEARDSVVVPINSGGKLQVQELTLNGDDSVSVRQTIDAGSVSLLGAYGISIDQKGRLLMAVPALRQVVVVDLEAGSALAVPWGIEVAGPTDIILVP
jgi:hypothetical protein